MIQGIITATTKQKIDELEKEKADLLSQISKEEILHPKRTKEEILRYFYRYRDYNHDDFEDRRRLIDSFVNTIYLFDDKITFWLNFSDESETLTIAELKKIGLGSDLMAHRSQKKGCKKTAEKNDCILSKR